MELSDSIKFKSPTKGDCILLDASSSALAKDGIYQKLPDGRLALKVQILGFDALYVLPIASASTLGGIKVGSGLSIDPTTGVLSATGGGTGTVTLVQAGNLTPLFTTTVTNATTTPSITFTQVAQAANLVFAAPNGSTGVPTFRALVAADIPALSYISSIGVTAPLASTGGLTPTLSMPAAASGQSGYLTASDWAIFNGKQDALGFTPENVANKTDVMSGNTTSSTKYLSAKGVYDWVISLGYWVAVSATSLIAGIMKLYTSTGTNTDGTMTQKSITDELALKVPTTRNISTTSPLLGGGDLSADRTLSIQQATSGQSGYLSSTDWTNFNTAYTNRITSLTTTGSSGAATLSSNTLNIPNYTLSGLGGVPTSRTLTINGTAYDLSADRSWTISASVSRAYITSNVTTTSASITDITGMSFSVSAGKTYTVWGGFYATAGAGGIKFGVNCPTSTTIKMTHSGLATTSAYTTQVVQSNNALGGGSFVAGNGSISLIWVMCSFVTTNSGTIQFRFASTTAGNTSTIYADSWLHYVEG